MSARVGDQVKSLSPCNATRCCPHDWVGVISQGSPSTFVNSKPQARLGDQGMTNCPHGGVFKIITGSANATVDGKPGARVGDMVQCTKCPSQGFIMKGSENTFINSDTPATGGPRGD